MDILFVLLTLTLGIGTVLWSWKIYKISPWKTAGVIAVWLLLQALLAQTGFFRVWSAIPPHLGLVLLPNSVFLLWLATSSRLPSPLIKISAIPLILFQSFRIVMEGILYNLVHTGRLPEIMTFTGSNFDVFVGVSAPLIATLLYYSHSRRAYTVAVAWNLGSFAILINTVVHGILAAPTPFQVFHTSPANTLVAEYPWIWLPGFVVPCALAGHVMSARQLLARMRRRKT